MNEPTPDRAGRGQSRPSGPAGQGGGPTSYGKGAARPGAGGAGGKSSAGSRGGKSYGSSEARGDKKPYTKSADSRGDKKPYTKSVDSRGDKKPYAKSADSRGDKKPYAKSADSRGDSKPYAKSADSRGGRPYTKPGEARGDRPDSRSSGGDKKPYTRSSDSRGDRPYSKGIDSRGDRPYSSDSRGEKKPYGRSTDSRGEKKPYGRSTDSRGDRPYAGKSSDSRGDRPYSADSRGEKKPYGRSTDSRGDRPYAGKSSDSRGDRPYSADSRGQKKPYGRSTDSRGDRAYSKPGEPRGDRPYRRDERPPREAPRPGLAAKPNEPETPKGLDLRQLPRGVRAELRGLTSELAEVVGAHLLMAGQLIDTDPELAYAHAEAARRRAARLPITREAAAETAYAAGDFATALTEFRALRRMSGGNEYLPAMADCERALGRHQAALRLIKEGLASGPEAPAQIELRLVEAGIRTDTGHLDEALRLLRNEIETIGTRGTKLARARLRYAYADLLERTGEGEQAERWFDAVVRLDPEQETDAADRAAALRGLVIVWDDSDEDLEAEESADEDAGEGEPPTDGAGETNQE